MTFYALFDQCCHYSLRTSYVNEILAILYISLKHENSPKCIFSFSHILLILRELLILATVSSINTRIAFILETVVKNQ